VLTRLLLVQVLQLSQAVLRVESTVAPVNVDIVKVHLALARLCAGRGGRFLGDSVGNLAPELFQSEVEGLQIENQLISDFKLGGSFYLHTGAIDAHARGLDRAAKQTRKPRAMNFHADAAVAGNLELTRARQLLNLNNRRRRRLLS